MQQIRRHSSLAAAMGGLSVSTQRTASSSNPQLRLPPPQWMLFNDFVITETSAAEVQAVYGGQKMPCMLYYTRVSLWLLDSRAPTCFAVEPHSEQRRPHFLATRCCSLRTHEHRVVASICAASRNLRRCSVSIVGMVEASDAVGALQVEAEEAAAARPVDAPPPVLTFDEFQQLCLAQPLQVRMQR